VSRSPVRRRCAGVLGRAPVCCQASAAGLSTPAPPHAPARQASAGMGRSSDYGRDRDRDRDRDRRDRDYGRDRSPDRSRAGARTHSARARVSAGARQQEGARCGAPRAARRLCLTRLLNEQAGPRPIPRARPARSGALALAQQAWRRPRPRPRPRARSQTQPRQGQVPQQESLQEPRVPQVCVCLPREKGVAGAGRESGEGDLDPRRQRLASRQNLRRRGYGAAVWEARAGQRAPGALCAPDA